MPKDIEEAKNEEIEEAEEPSGSGTGTGESTIGGGLFGPGIVFLFFGILLDIATLICVPLIFLFGIGLLLAKVVYIVGLCIFIPWGLINSRNVKSSVAGKQKAAKSIMKRMLPKLAIRIVPLFGDAIPGIWTWTAYDMLKAS